MVQSRVISYNGGDAALGLLALLGADLSKVISVTGSLGGWSRCFSNYRMARKFSQEGGFYLRTSQSRPMMPRASVAQQRVLL